MTKRQIVEEMIEGLNYSSGNKKVVENCCKSTKSRIELVYNHYLKSNKTKEDRRLFINVLMTF